MNVRSRRRRQFVESLKKAAIWGFIAVFVVSILGVAVVTVAR